MARPSVKREPAREEGDQPRLVTLIVPRRVPSSRSSQALYILVEALRALPLQGEGSVHVEASYEVPTGQMEVALAGVRGRRTRIPF
jgi:hypothetical protein